MSTQVFYPTDPLDGSIAPESLLMGNDFPPEFLSLAALDKDHHELPMASMHYQPGPSPETTHMARAMNQPPPQAEELQNRPRPRNRALRPAPRDTRRETLDTDGAGMSGQQQASFMNPYHPTHSLSSFSFTSSSIDRDPDFTYEDMCDPSYSQDRISPLSTRSQSQGGSHESPPPTSLRWRNSTGTGTNDMEKRAKHLERNRAAASKSRQKKKRETDNLRSRFQEASRRKSGLEIEIKDLHSQLLSLKDQILMHSRCDDDAIRVYLGRMVKQATRTDSLSSVSSGEVEAESLRASNEHDHSREHMHEQVGDRISSPEDMNNASSHVLEAQQQQEPQQQIPMRMGDATLPCGIEKSMLGSMFPHGDGNIFDLQMGMT